MAEYSAFISMRTSRELCEINEVLGCAKISWTLLRRQLGDAIMHREPALVLSDAPEKMELAEWVMELKALCAAHGAQLVMWLPTTAGGDPGLGELVRAGRQCAVAVLVPVEGATMAANEFVGGYHLKPDGARVMTRVLAAKLQDVLRRPHDR